MAFYNSHRPSSGGRKEPRWIKVNIHDINSIKPALANVSVIYHLIGIIAETRTLSFEQTMIRGTRNLIDAGRSSGVRKIIYLSALGTSSNPVTKYFSAKWESEQIIRNSGLEYVILRPSIIYGPGDKFINVIARLLKYSPIMPVPVRGQQIVQPIYVNDLVAIMRQLLANERALSRTLEIGGPVAMEYREMVSIIKKVLKKRAANVYIPLWLLNIMAVGMEKLMKPAPFTTDQLKMLDQGNSCNNAEAFEVLDIKLTALEDGLRNYLR